MGPRTILRATVALMLTAAIGAVTVPASSGVSVAPLPPVDTSQHFRVMPLGDSITVGYGSSTGDSYRWDLARYITEVQQIGTADYVGSQTSGQEPNPHHEGHAGWTIADLTPLASGWVTTYKPDVILLHAGVNDARAGATAQQMADRMRDLLAAVLGASPTVRVVVGDVIAPWYGTTNDAASVAVQQFNELLPGIVAAAGPRVSLARMSAAVPSNLLPDGLHPSDTGYRYMAWVWCRCMSPLLSADGITRSGRDPLPIPVPQSVLCPTT